MKSWRKPVASLAFILICAALIAWVPLSTLAAPQGVAGTPLFLPVVRRDGPTPTPTATVTPTSTATPTGTLTPTPTATPITPTIPITVAPSVLHVF